MPRNANQSKHSNYSLLDEFSGGIDLGTTMNITGNLSISGWFKPRGTTQDNSVLVGKYLSSSVSPYFIFIARINSSGGVEWRIGTDTANPLKYYSVNSTTIVRDSNNYEGSWFHFTGTWDGVNIKIYINGVLEGTTAAYGNLDATAGLHTSIAAVYLSAGSPLSSLNGASNNVSIFDYALSQGQITTLYGDSTSGPGNPMALPSSPIAYYPLGTSAWNGEYLAENNAIGDYVFDFIPNDSIDTNFTLPNYNSYSISVWYKKDRGTVGALPGGDHYLWGNAASGGANKPRTSVRFNDTNELRIITGDGTVYFQSPDLNVSTLLLDGKWHHILTTTVSGEIKLYIDGDLQATHTNSNIITGIVAETSYRIGQSGYNAGYLTESLLSNFQIFNTALSATEVETLYNYGSPIQTLANIPQSSNLKAWYKLDASEIYNSTSTEWSVDNNQNPSAYASSLDFSGTSQYISCSSSSVFQNTSNFSVSFWVNMDDYSGGGCFLMAQGGGSSIFHIYAYGGNTIQVRLRKNGLGNGIISNINLNNKWNNICLVYDGTQTGNSNMLKFYLNKLEQTISFNSDIQSSINISSNFLIGQQSGQSGVYTIDGKLSNVSLFSNSLTDGTGGTVNQIETLYNNGTPLADMSSFSSLVSWWKLDNTTTGIEDSKGTNNGTNNGATEYPGFVNTLAGESSGMSQSNLVQSDLQTVAPYSKYALSFDGTNDYIDCGDSDSFSFGNGTTDSSFSISAWVNMIDATNFITIAKDANSGREYVIRTLSDDKLYFYLLDNINGGYIGRISSGTVTSNQGTWIHTLYTYNGNSTSSGIKIYLNGSQVDNANYEGGSYTAMSNTSTNLNVGRQERGLHYGSGSISNVSIFDSALTSSQVREIYNEGLPSDLNTFSGAAPVAWWQLGSNSSWNGNRWIVADEIGSNNGYSQNMSPYMPESGLTNGVGTTANGVSSGMSEGSLVGDAPYSTGNAVSSGMPVTARGNDVPPTP